MVALGWYFASRLGCFGYDAQGFQEVIDCGFELALFISLRVLLESLEKFFDAGSELTCLIALGMALDGLEHFDKVIDGGVNGLVLCITLRMFDHGLEHCDEVFDGGSDGFTFLVTLDITFCWGCAGPETTFVNQAMVIGQVRGKPLHFFADTGRHVRWPTVGYA